jgi:signal transduction histidine kinase
VTADHDGVTELDDAPASVQSSTGQRSVRRPTALAEQTALRRVAELVARGAGRERVLNAIVAEAFGLFPVDFTALLAYGSDGEASIVAVDHGPPGLMIGERAPHIPDGLVLRVFRSGRPVRVDAYADVTSPEVARMHELSITAGAAAPIVVDGRLWGVLAAMTSSGPVLADLEHRLADFADLAATAVATAHVKDELRELLDEQAALRRVAEVAALGAEPASFFHTLAEEASRLGGHTLTVARFDSEGAASVVAASGDPAVKSSADFIRDSSASTLRQSAGAVRIEDYAAGSGSAPAEGRDVDAGVAVPIMVAGTVWGSLIAAPASRPLPPSTEQRLTQFAHVASMAMSSAMARADVQWLADEQAALRRVAELVARGAGERQLFDAVTHEASLLSHQATTLVQFVGDRTFTVVSSYDGPAPVGSTVAVPLDDQGPVADILRTGQSARLDDYGSKEGPLFARAEFGVSSGVAVPIVVDGGIWGLLGVTTTGHRLPDDTERRLQQFAELVAAALANRQARTRVEQLAKQQAALRHVAELAARDAPAREVLDAVSFQASKLTGVDFTTVLSYAQDGSTEIVALSGAPVGLRVGMHAPGHGDGAVQRVWRTHRSARVDNLGSVCGHWPQVAHGFGFSTSAAVPIVIQGQLWGALVVVGRDEPLPDAIEESLTGFADLAGTAISAAQARQEVRALVDEQAAFRRVAELVAHGTVLDEVFGAVTIEAAKLLGGMPATLRRFDPDDAVTTVASSDTSSLDAAAALAVPVTVEGRVWGELSTSGAGAAVPAGAEERLQQFAELAAAAIANAENKAQLTASRARVVATADETRRRLQRDVHDGAQQRLVQTVITLKLAQSTVAQGTAIGDRIAEALYHAERANTELRDLVHGILPASLIEGGLRTGIDSLVDDMSIPVFVQLAAPPLPTETETTAYFIVAEALTNVVKHARASHAAVTVALTGAALSIDVVDDGVGGANPSSGGGLTGVSDRIEAAGGTLSIASVAGRGTTLSASLPIPEPAS